MISLSARNEISAIDAIKVGIVGIVRIQAKSSKKLKLKIVWLKAESTPPHFANATIIVIKATTAKGARKYTKKVGGNGFLY